MPNLIKIVLKSTKIRDNILQFLPIEDLFQICATFKFNMKVRGHSWGYIICLDEKDIIYRSLSFPEILNPVRDRCDHLNSSPVQVHEYLLYRSSSKYIFLSYIFPKTN